MNQRIKQLAHQADWDDEFREDFDIEKFAELIIDECALVANEHVEEAEGVHLGVGRRIKQHFGVDE
jgi:hypothetical protein